MSAKTAALITDAAKLTAAIGVASKASHSLDASIQIILASATFFALKDGNTQPINAIFTSLGKGVRRAAIASWLLKFAPVLMNKDDKAAKEQPFVFSRDKVAQLVHTDKPTAEQAETHATSALAVAWTDFKPEQIVPESFDVHAMLSALIKSAKGLQTKGSKPKHADLLGKLEALVATPAAEPVAPL